MQPLTRRRASIRSDSGFTLIEVLVSITILSIAGVAVLAGLQLSLKSSDIHRKQSTGGAYVRSYAEAIEAYLNTTGHYVNCAGPNAYNVPAVLGQLSSLPGNYTPTHSAATPLTGGGAAASTAPCGDKGVQRITLALTVPRKGGSVTEKLTIVVRKACGTGTSCP
ncbi:MULTISPECIES: prepilin-type N-terminal cleavage/methylation domain-containing protein [unclassified Nocardioides]|uniref:type IV pilus modification PilV family protein n=1 Tax=unclassified Nocardioides TaxID=2615069 RepID=UPI00070308F8|nr:MULTISPECIES: type II secretion system protein [unclassified Nocardioides]KRC56961.1 hypothetical protein ASE19_03930 [Nocardioides sp. Root79]KRC77170.1 hypothetical protein ASE20_02795 [Nocardioides sp. Root240]